MKDFLNRVSSSINESKINLKIIKYNTYKFNQPNIAKKVFISVVNYKVFSLSDSRKISFILILLTLPVTSDMGTILGSA